MTPNRITLIWYNPDIDAYEKGKVVDYKSAFSLSKNKNRFEIIYEFYQSRARLIDKILRSLNRARALSINT